MSEGAADLEHDGVELARVLIARVAGEDHPQAEVARSLVLRSAVTVTAHPAYSHPPGSPPEFSASRVIAELMRLIGIATPTLPHALQGDPAIERLLRKRVAEELLAAAEDLPGHSIAGRILRSLRTR